MRVRDERYKEVRHMILEGRITTIDMILKYIPLTVLANHLGINSARFKRMFANPIEFNFEEINALAQYCDVVTETLISINTRSIAEGKGWPKVQYSQHTINKGSKAPLPKKRNKKAAAENPTSGYCFQNSPYN